MDRHDLVVLCSKHIDLIVVLCSEHVGLINMYWYYAANMFTLFSCIMPRTQDLIVVLRSAPTSIYVDHFLGVKQCMIIIMLLSV